MDADQRVCPAGKAPPGTGQVALFASGGSPYHHRYVLAQAGIRADFLDAEQIRVGALAAYQALIVPGGGDHAMAGQLRPLGEEGCRAVASFVEGGGLYIGCCAGAVIACAAPRSLVDACPEQRALRLLDVPAWNQDAREPDGLRSPGIGAYVARVLAPGHPIVGDLPETFEITHYNGPLFGPLPEGSIALFAPAALTERFTPAERFLQDAQAPGATTLMERAIAQGQPAAVVGPRGKGQVVLFGSHPEFGVDSLLEEIGPAARLLTNAIRWHAGLDPGDGPAEGSPTGQRSPVGGFAREQEVPHPRILCAQLCTLLDTLIASAARVAAAAAALGMLPLTPEPDWLDPRRCLALCGLAPLDVWRTHLASIERRTSELEGLVSEVKGRLAAMGDPQLIRLYHDLAHRPAHGQDHGYTGMLFLLRRALAMLRRARQNWAITLPPPNPDPYQNWQQNPYHLAVGSYLAAAGLVQAAVLQARSTLLETSIGNGVRDAIHA